MRDARAVNPLERKVAVTNYAMLYLRSEAFNQPPKKAKAFIRAADILEENLLKYKEQSNFIQPLILNR